MVRMVHEYYGRSRFVVTECEDRDDVVRVDVQDYSIVLPGKGSQPESPGD
jgi:hypothetical protein